MFEYASSGFLFLYEITHIVVVCSYHEGLPLIHNNQHKMTRKYVMSTKHLRVESTFIRNDIKGKP